jgi:ribosomal protein S27E
LKIFELEASELPEEVTDFVAVECANCEYEGEGSFSQKYFRTEPEIECDATHDQAIELLRHQGYSQYTAFPADSVILSVSKCPNCGSEDIIRDY